MRPSLRVLMVACLVLMAGCRPRFLSLLESPSVTARDLLEDVRQAQSGGRRVLTMQFMSEETYHPGTLSLLYPELAPNFVARSSYDFERGRAWQRTAHGHHSVLWSWDGTALLTTRDGVPYTPAPGADRALHLRAMLILLQPAEAIARSAADLVRVADHDGNPRIRARGVHEDVPEIILEVDRESGLLAAMEYRLRGMPALAAARVELSDYWEVDGVMIPHVMTGTIPTSGAGVEFHSMFLWDVKVAVASAYPVPLEPNGPARPVLH